MSELINPDSRHARSSVRVCDFCMTVAPYTFVHYGERGETRWLCRECSSQAECCSEGECDRHVRDYRIIQTNREMIWLADMMRALSTPVNFPGMPMQTLKSEYAEPNTVYFAPDASVLRRIHERDPTADLRRFFGVIKNVGG